MEKDTTSVIAARLATETANKAAELATTAAKTATDLATKTAETTTAINVNMEWMKKSLSGIEITLNEMNKAFVTSVQHQEVLKRIEEHEARLNVLESSSVRQVVLTSIGTGILTLLTSILIWHLLGK